MSAIVDLFRISGRLALMSSKIRVILAQGTKLTETHGGGFGVTKVKISKYRWQTGDLPALLPLDTRMLIGSELKERVGMPSAEKEGRI